MLIEPGALRSGIWDKTRDDLLWRRPGSDDPTAYDRSFKVLGILRRLLGPPGAAAEVISDALTAERPRSHYRVGAAAAIVEFLDLILPTTVKDRMARRALGR